MNTPLHFVRDGKKIVIPLEGDGAVKTGHIEVDGVTINATHGRTHDNHWASVSEVFVARIGADDTLAPGKSVDLEYIPGGSVRHEAEEL